MKKYCYFLLLLCFLILTGCSSTYQQPAQPDIEYEADGTKIKREERGDTYYFENLPRNIIYNDTSFSLDFIEFYESSLVEFENSLYILLYFNMNQMSEEDLHWFKKEMDENTTFRKPLYTDVDLISEANDFDHEPMYCEKHIYFADGYMVSVYSLHGYRYSLAGGVLDISMYVKQGGTYEYLNDEGEISDLDKSDTYYKDVTLPQVIDGLDVFAKNRLNVYKAVFE